MSEAIVNAISGAQVIALVALVAANFILRVMAEFKNQSFTVAKLGDFVTARILPLICYLVVAALADFADGWNAVAIAIYAGLTAMYGTAILRALKDLTGLPLPDILQKKDK